MTANENRSVAPQGFGDRRMEIIMGRLLQAGVILASAVVLLGGVLYLRDSPHKVANFRIFSVESASLRYPSHLFPLVARGDAVAIIQLGVLLLIATPIARVAFALVAFAIERDRLYVMVSFVVLAVLIFGIFR
jgi:uncharacterized membrane protein